MKLARPLVWTLVGLAVAVVVVVFVATRCAGSDRAREQIERRLSEAVARPVTIGALEVSNAATHAELRDVVIAPPPAELAAPPAEEVAKGVLGGPLRRALTEPPAE